MELKDQYRTLGQLKKIEEKIFRLRNEIERIPLEINTLDQQLAKRNAAFGEIKSKFENQEKTVRKYEQDLREKEDFLRKAESKMMEVKTNVEYQAAMRENDGHKKEKGVLEERVLQLISELEGQKATLKTAETEFKEFEKTILENKSRLQEEHRSLTKSFEELLEKRKASCSELPTDIAGLYQRAVNTTKGVPIVLIDRGMCLGCNMKVRPQLYNEIIGFKALHRCPSCNRILIADAGEPEVEKE